MKNLLSALRKQVVVGFVGGSDLVKQQEQLGEHALDMFDYGFSENGLSAYKCGKLISEQSFIKFLGEEKYKKFVNFVLRYLADLELPKKRGTFVEFRKGMVNLCPIGRSCTYEERLEFADFDEKNKVREKLVEALKKEFASYGLQYSIGGQISIDVFPQGWDKTYCLNHVAQEGFKEIHFFGDKTMEGGNDYEIFHDKRVIGHTVKDPSDTAAQLRKLFNL